MQNNTLNTRTALILAAGELFAEHGFEAVSTRMIADKAGVNLGGIHYHFGGKENLHVGIFEYFMQEDRMPNLGSVLAQNPGKDETPEGRAWIILETVTGIFKYLMDPVRPRWKWKLFARELITPTAVLRMVTDEVCGPERKESVAFYLRCQPKADKDTAHAWSDILMSSVIFHMLAEDLIGMIRQAGKQYDEYMADVGKMTAKAMILSANLPIPKELLI